MSTAMVSPQMNGTYSPAYAQFLQRMQQQQQASQAGGDPSQTMATNGAPNPADDSTMSPAGGGGPGSSGYVDPTTGMAANGAGISPVSAGGPATPPLSPAPFNASLPDGSNPSNLPSGDPNVLNRMVLANQLGQGQQMIQQSGQRGDYYTGQEQEAQNNLTSLYNPIWQDPNAGGYSQQQQQEIMGNNTGNPYTDINNLAMTAGQQQSNFIPQSDQTNILGDPYQAEHIAANDGANLQGASNNESDLQRAIDQRGASQISGAVNQMSDAYGNAIDPSKLGVSDQYINSQGNALSTATGDTSSALDNPDLNVTDQFKTQAGMTDQEVADTAALSARSAGAGYQALQDQTNQAALAAGETNPMALAAEQSALERSKGAAVTDATVQGQLAARAAQRTAASNVQSTELGAGQYKTGAQLSNAQQLLSQRLGASQNQENTRLGAEQDISNRQIGAATNVGQAAVGAGEFAQQAEGGTEANVAARGQQEGEFTAGQDVAATQAAEQNLSNRYQTIAQNNQSTNMYNQQQQFNQNFALNNALSQRQAAIAQQQQGVQAEGRQAAGNLLQYQGGQANTAFGQQQQAYGTEAGAVNQAASTYSGAKQAQDNNGFFGSQGLFGKLLPAAAQVATAGINANAPNQHAAGGIVDQPTYFKEDDGSTGVMGEAGPEAIVPLDNPEPMIDRIRREHAKRFQGFQHPGNTQWDDLEEAA